MRKSFPNLSDGLAVDERAELGDLNHVAERMAGYIAPQPSREETAKLLAHLRPLVRARAEELETPAWTEPESGMRQRLTLAWSQMRLMEPAFWWASGLLFALGILLTVLFKGGALSTAFVLLLPVLTAAGVAYAFRPTTRSLWELERTLPIRPLELLYARLGLVVAFNLVLSTALLGVMAAQEPRLVLWRLVIIWFGPMLALTGLALYASVRWGSVAGATAPMGLWAGLLALGWGWVSPDGSAVLNGLLPSITQSAALLNLSVLLMLVGLILLRQGGKLAMGDGAEWD